MLMLIINISRIVHIQPSISSDILMRLSHLTYYYQGKPESSLNQIKQCLHTDPESSVCKKFFKVLKNDIKDINRAMLFSQSNNWRALASVITGQKGLINRINEGIKTGNDLNEWKSLAIAPIPNEIYNLDLNSALKNHFIGLACKAYVQLNDLKKAESCCEQTLSFDPNNLDGLIARAEGFIVAEDFEKAVDVFEKAFEASGRSSRDVSKNFIFTKININNKI